MKGGAGEAFNSWADCSFFVAQRTRFSCKLSLSVAVLLFSILRGFQMRTLTLLVSLICVLFSVESALADKRVAFVVGNGAYKNVAQLPNPALDAKAMASTLRNVGVAGVRGT